MAQLLILNVDSSRNGGCGNAVLIQDGRPGRRCSYLRSTISNSRSKMLPAEHPDDPTKKLPISYLISASTVDWAVEKASGASVNGILSPFYSRPNVVKLAEDS
jgi:hypothetical protein